jgi:hypothetical protein
MVCSVSQQFQRSTTSYGDAATVRYEPKDRVRVDNVEPQERTAMATGAAAFTGVGAAFFFSNGC